MSLLVFGTVALDNVKTPSGDRNDMLGGSAAHFSMAARLFTDVHLVAGVGKDFPAAQLEFLKKKGLDTSSLKEVDGTTFRWEGEYKKEDLNTALTLQTQLGVLQTYVPEIHPAQAEFPYIFMGNYDPDVQAQLLPLLKKPRLVGLDSMNLWINTKRQSLLKLMKQVDLFVANDAEARALSEEDNLIRAARRLRQCGPKLIVIKKGEHGVLVYSDDFMFSFPAYPIEQVVDPTGAGDTFAGGLMGYLTGVKKFTRTALKKAVLHATVLASFNVEGFGMERTAHLTIGEVQDRLKDFTKFISVV
ncbi:MAG: PfkB family carbohydrate kinase [Candidatus Omnitrophota bacterium]|nr:PfkB family carbohydrate kinase [Candidatus Omnitrophota bacterium]MDZ4243346.1 PfkB family carbohydrate kinase [Candidatus Omnitrophota bacterium]